LGRSDLYQEMIDRIKERGGYFEGMQRS